MTNTGGLHSYGGIPFYGTDSSGNNTADAGQRYLVYTIKTTDGDVTGSTADKEQALQYASAANMTIGTKTNPTTSDLAFLKSELNAGRWVVASTIPVSGSAGLPGHSVVINYYSSTNSLWGIWDPWDDSNYYFFESSLLSETIKLKADPAGNRKVRWYHYCK